MPLQINGILYDELTADPGAPVEGQVWYNSAERRIKGFVNGAVRLLEAQHNIAAVSDPAVGNDSTQGYSIGSRWLNVSSDTEWVCLDASVGAAVWKDTTSGSSGISAAQHAALRQLIHFVDNGPAETFATGAYREMTGTTFPTAVIWYDSSAPGKKKIVEKLITYSGAFPATITWMVYDALEVLQATVVDTLTYSGAFETSRLRAIT